MQEVLDWYNQVSETVQGWGPMLIDKSTLISFSDSNYIELKIFILPFCI
jgi:hypothetical protein